ncbi:MAG: RND family transporter [Chloroflexi bacterium]|nr:RND family transporter [Chloroflexota bacterium]
MNKSFNRLGIFIKNKHLILTIICLSLIIPSIIGALHLKMETGDNTFVSADSQVYRDYQRFTQRFSDRVVIVLVTADDLAQLVQPGNMAAMQAIEDRMVARTDVVSAIGPAFLIEQAVAQKNGSAELPTDPQAILEIITDPQNGTVRTDFRQVFPDNRHALIAITIGAKLSQDKQADMIKQIKQTVAGAGFTGDASAVVTGLPALRSDMEDLMQDSMRNMLILSVALMLAILAFIFRVRGFFAWRWLSLGIVFLGIIYTFGAMGILSTPITMVTMSVLPIVVGLGVDYAIQFHNRYDEERRKDKSTGDSIVNSVTYIGPAIGIAIVAACLGFAALFFSPVPMIRDFGLTLIIGVTACYLVSMVVLLTILYWHDRRQESRRRAAQAKARPQPDKQSTNIVEKGLSRLAPWVIKKPLAIVSVAALLAVAGLLVDSHIHTETSVMKFISQDIQAVRNMNAVESLGRGLVSTNLLVEAEDVADPAILAWVWQIEQRVNEEQSDIVAGTSSIADIIVQANGGQIPQDSQEVRQILEGIPEPIKRNLITDDFMAANIIVYNREVQTDVFEQLAKDLRDYTSERPDGVNVTVTGNTEIQVKLANALTSGREKMTLLGIAFVFVGILILFRFRLLRALLAILPMILIIGWSSVVMYLLGIKYTPLTATLGALIIGIGVEFTILLMMRYYEERNKGENPPRAMTTSIVRIGRAITASGFTVIGGFGALLIATGFPVLQDFGVVTMVNVFFALVAALVVLPPLIVWLDSWREKLGRMKRSAAELDPTGQSSPR